MTCLATCNRAVLSGFYKYGHLVGKHPWVFIILPVLICGGLATGFLFVNPQNDIEELYAPEGSQADHDREIVRAFFPDHSGHNFDPFSANEFILQGTVIFRGLDNINVLSDEVVQELTVFIEAVKNISVDNGDYNFTLVDVCAKQYNSCVVDGSFVTDPFFRSLLKMGVVQFPVWASLRAYDLSLSLSRVNISSGILISANTLKMSFVLRQDTDEYKEMSNLWEAEFTKFMQEYNFVKFEVAYSTSLSLEEELDKGTSGDVFYFSLTFTLMITYASIVSAGGDCVSTRALLANAGVIAAGLGIMGSFGLITLIGVRFVNIVGVMPFLTLGIGVDDMFLLMATWSETLSKTELSVPERIGTVFKKAGIGITITSVTDFLSFAVGATSVFRSVRNFCIYTGTGVLLCFICNATFFGGCLTLHGRRVYSSRHTVTCQNVDKSRGELKEEGRTCCFLCMCGGETPERSSQDQSLCEKGPRYALPRFVMWLPMRILILIVFAGDIGVSVWGCTQLRQGLELKDLVLTSSYFHKFQTWDGEDFGVKLPVSFVTTQTLDYRQESTIEDIKSLLHTAQLDHDIDPMIDNCWLLSYAKTNFFNTTNDQMFFQGLRDFLVQNPRYYNDIVFSNTSNNTIIASRCQVYSYAVSDSNDQADLMGRMRKVVSGFPSMDFAYHPAFIFFEQYLAVLPSTLQTVGITMAVMFVVTCFFLPQPVIVVLVMVQVLMIVTGVFGFMTLWGLSLSSITMIHLIMSVGFSVDFCAHVCAAYMVSEEASRVDRAKDAIVHASGPILNGAVSSFIGIVVLIFAESYIFQSFFKIMLLVIGFGAFHAVLLVPVALSFIGPDTYIDLDKIEKKSAYIKNVPQVGAVTGSNGVKSGSPHHDRGLHENGHDNGYENKGFDAGIHLGYLK